MATFVEWKVPQPIAGSGTVEDPYIWPAGTPAVIGVKARYCRECGGRLYHWTDGQDPESQPMDGCIC